MDAKEQAEQHRKIADAYVALADAFEPLHREIARGFRVTAEPHREKADDLDPPQPVWHSGDLAREGRGDLWQFDGEWWHLNGMKRSTASLNSDLGPIRKVHIADPARHEVVVSLDGIKSLDEWADDFEINYANASAKVAIRAAKAAREQLGEVQ